MTAAQFNPSHLLPAESVPEAVMAVAAAPMSFSMRTSPFVEGRGKN